MYAFHFDRGVRTQALQIIDLVRGYAKGSYAGPVALATDNDKFGRAVIRVGVRLWDWVGENVDDGVEDRVRVRLICQTRILILVSVVCKIKPRLSGEHYCANEKWEI